MGIVVTGAVFVDVKGFPSGHFIPRGRNAGKVEYVHGGVSRNIVENLANIGLDTAFVSLVDETGAGRDVIAHLADHHVRTEFIRTVPGGMGTWLAVFDDHGDVFASVSQRPDLTPLKETLRECGDRIFEHADSFLLEIDMDEELVMEFLTFAEKYHVPVFAAVSNMSIALRRREYLRRCACFICNLDEASQFFRIDLDRISVDELPDMLSSLIRDAGIPAMVITLGKDGCVYASSTGEKGQLPSLDVRVLDTTGAGDAFFAGTCAALTYGLDLRSACRIGTVLSASVISTVSSTCEVMDPVVLGFPPSASRR